MNPNEELKSTSMAKQVLEDYATQQTEFLEEELTTLHQQLLEREIEVERLRGLIDWDEHNQHCRSHKGEHCTCWVSQYQSPPTNSASRILELARAFWRRFHECGMGEYCGCCSRPYVQDAVAAIQPEDKILLGIKEGE